MISKGPAPPRNPQASRAESSANRPKVTAQLTSSSTPLARAKSALLPRLVSVRIGEVRPPPLITNLEEETNRPVAGQGRQFNSKPMNTSPPGAVQFAAQRVQVWPTRREISRRRNTRRFRGPAPKFATTGRVSFAGHLDESSTLLSHPKSGNRPGPAVVQQSSWPTLE